MEEQLTKKQRRELKKQERKEKEVAMQKKKQQKTIITWSVVIVVLLAVIWGLTQLGGSTPGDQLVTTDALGVTEQSHVKGNREAKVVLVEFSDFQCPACASYQGVLTQLVEEYGDRLALVYRHFPLKSIHPNADLAARAAEAASRQGKFWEMHDQLFARQTTWTSMSSGQAEAEFIGYAESMDLDVGQFTADLEADEVHDIVDQDLAIANQLGLRGTPSFFLNGTQLQNPGSYAEFQALIEAELAKVSDTDNATTGTIEGLLSYPSEVLPDLRVCAEDVETQEMYCTDKNELVASHEPPLYTGTGYQLEVPVGTYHVYAFRPDDQEGELRGLYSQAVPCGLTVECTSHELIPVDVAAGEIVRAIHPADWYSQNN